VAKKPAAQSGDKGMSRLRRTNQGAPAANGHTTPRSFDTEPISRVEWVEASTLHANNYNPNAVAPPERELIVLSILEDGWTQPVVILPDGEIVDGFHRWLFSQQDERLLARYHGYVPVTRIVVDKVHQQMSTIRHNRARGTHAILRMADIVTGMLKEGIPAKKIMAGLGMDDEEVTRLATALGMPELGSNTNFSPAWKPGVRQEP
jgi:ParB-like chromosome segregation protein Spo0J